MGVKGQIFAIDNRCPHEGFPLSKGFANDNCVLTCNWHNWKFNLKTGECLLGEDNVRNYPINIENGNIYVDINDPSIDQIKKSIYKGLKTAFKERQYGRIAREITRLQFNNLNSKSLKSASGPTRSLAVSGKLRLLTQLLVKVSEGFEGL